MFKRFFTVVCLTCLFCLPAVSPHFSSASILDDAKNHVKKTVKKVEHTLGWDRYILCWGDRFVPPEDRWVAIRSGLPRAKNSIGLFWDIAGDGKAVQGPGKEIKLWDITFQEYPQPDRRYRFIPVYDKTRNPDDYGYYLIQCKTGMYLQAGGRGEQLRLNRGYNLRNSHDRRAASYQWNVKNVGKNRFTFVSRENGLAIDARGGKAHKGVPVQLYPDKGQTAVQWEFIYIAEGSEVKSTSEMAEKRAHEVRKMAKEVSHNFSSIADAVSHSVISRVKTCVTRLDDKLVSLKRQGHDYTLRVGFPDQRSIFDEVKGQTIDRLVKIDLKKITFAPGENNTVTVGLINRVECLGHSVELSAELTGRWTLSRDGLVVDHFVVNRCALPLLPDDLTRQVRHALSKETSRLRVNIRHFPGSDILAGSPGKSSLKLRNVKRGPYGFEARLTM